MKKVVFGVVITTILFFIIFLVIGSSFTDKYVEDELQKLTVKTDSPNKFFNSDSLKGLPFSVQKYFKNSIKEGRKHPKLIRVEQEALLLTDETSDWNEVIAKQYYSTDKPGFVWDAKIKMSEFVWTRAVESYINGKGNHIVKLFSTLNFSSISGREIDQSNLLRYLSEAVLFPTALLPNDKLEWKLVEQGRAKAIFRDNGIKVEADFYFNAKGEIEKIVTMDKFRTSKAGYSKNKFTISFSEYKEIDDFKVPTYMELEWNLDSGVFKYGKFRITKIDYDNYDID